MAAFNLFVTPKRVPVHSALCSNTNERAGRSVIVLLIHGTAVHLIHEDLLRISDDTPECET